MMSASSVAGGANFAPRRTSVVPQSLSSFGGYLGSALQSVTDTAQSNSAFNAFQASYLRDWQERMYQQSAEYNAAEAAKNRNWQEHMSNTAHQREIADLKAAGLNPILSASGGNGAAVTSGSTASVSTPSGASANADTSANAAIASLLTSWLGSMTQLEAQRVSAQNNLAVADKYNAANALIAQITGEYGLKHAAITGEFSNRSAAISADAAIKSAATHAAANNYQSRLQSATSKAIAKMNNETSKYINSQKIGNERYMAKYYPATESQLISTIAEMLNGSPLPDAAEEFWNSINSFWDTMY